MKFSFLKAAKKAVADDYKRQAVIGVAAGCVALTGQLIRSLKFNEFSGFMQGHLTNLADVAVFSAIWNTTQMEIADQLGYSMVSRPKTSAASILMLGILCEIFQARRNNAYDWIDTQCYAVSALAYLLTDALLAKSAKSQNLPECKI